MDLLKLKATLGLDTTEYEKGLNGAETKAKSIGGKIAGGMATAAKAGAVAVAAVGTATVAAGAAITHATGKVAEYGDNIDKMSQKMGLSAEKYQEWDAILQHSGTSIEAMKPSMKTLAVAAESGSDAFQKLGMSQQEVANMSQEELFEKTISALQNVEDDTERTYLASKLLGRGATELGALLNTSAEDTEKMRQRVHDLGGVMSDEAVKASAAYQDSLQDMTTAMDGMKRNAIANFLPGMTSIMDGLTNIFAGESGGQKKIQEGVDSIIKKFGELAPKGAKVISKVAGAIFKAVLDNLPSITENLVKFVINAINGLVSAIPTIADAAMTIIQTIFLTLGKQMPKLLSGLGDALKDGLPLLLEKCLKMLESLIDGFEKNADGFIEAGGEFIAKLIEGLSKALPILIEHVPVIILKLNIAIIKNLPAIIKAGGRILSALLKGLVNAIISIPKAVSRVVGAMKSQFGRTNWNSVGKHIMMGIANGIANYAFFPLKAMSNLASRLYERAKSAFQINSPSKLFRDKIGSGIDEGVAAGVLDKIPVVTQAMDELNSRIISAYTSPDYISYSDGDGFDEETAYDVLNTPVPGTTTEMGGRDVTVVLQLDRTQLARTVFRLNGEESQRVGVSLAGGVV